MYAFQRCWRSGELVVFEGRKSVQTLETPFRHSAEVEEVHVGVMVCYGSNTTDFYIKMGRNMILWMVRGRLKVLCDWLERSGL